MCDLIKFEISLVKDCNFCKENFSKQYYTCLENPENSNVKIYDKSN